MSTSTEASFPELWQTSADRPTVWDELPTDGSHAWLGLLLVLASSIVAIRGLCWITAQTIRLLH